MLAKASSPSRTLLMALRGLRSRLQKRLLRRDAANQHARRARSPDRTCTARHAIFFRNCSAQRMNSRLDITMSTARFGQYSKKFAPRRMIARISAMK